MFLIDEYKCMTKRKSNFEILRIIGVILIIFHHYGIHGSLNYDSIEISNLSINIILIQFLSSFGKSSTSIFVLISGYFLIDSKITYRKLIPIIAKMFFYSYSILITIYVLKTTPITYNNFINSLLPIFGENWFVVYYLLLYLILTFLNPMLLSLTKKSYFKFIIILIVFWSFIPSITGYKWSFSAIDYFIVVYIIGAYIKLHLKTSYKNNINLYISLSIILLILLYILFSDYLGIKLNNAHIVNNHMDFLEINSFLPLVLSIFLFLYFKNINFSNSLVNNIASSSLGIYLIHDNPLIRHLIWTGLSPNSNYINSNYMILHFIAKVSTVFIVSLIIDKIYSITLEKYINILFYKIYTFRKFIYTIL